jgi:hypothetical protein
MGLGKAALAGGQSQRFLFHVVFVMGSRLLLGEEGVGSSYPLVECSEKYPFHSAVSRTNFKI